jgi:hypothetical protein
MYSTLGAIDDHVKYHLAEIMREAEHQRLVALATQPGRPLRVRIADALVVIAERLEGRPRQTVARAT